MAFKTITGDITKQECDVIINSVGVTTNIYGGICGSIVNASQSKELDEIIKKANDLYFVGEFFFTKNYGLPCKNIIHLITPNHKDDKKYMIYKECIRRILNECNFHNWHNIAIPSLGTGANGYDKDIARTIISNMCEAYCEAYENMNITLVLPEKDISSDNDYRLIRESYSEGQPHSPETLKKFRKGARLLFGVSEVLDYSFSKKYFAYESTISNRKNIKVNDEDIFDIDTYVEKYIEIRSESDNHYSADLAKRRINMFLGYGKKGSDTYMHAGSDAYSNIRNRATADKKAFLKIVLALKMSVEEANDFMKAFGLCFTRVADINPDDDAVQELLNNREFGIVETERKIKDFFMKK